MHYQEAITIKQLYPELNEQQLQEAEENITAYLGLILRIFQRLEQDQSGIAELGALTEQNSLPRFMAKVDS